MQMLPLTYFAEHRSGELLTLLSNDAEEISKFVTTTLVQLLPLCLTFLGAFIIMAMMDPMISLLAITLMPIYFVVMKVLGRRIRPITSAWIVSWSSLFSMVQENLGLFPTIKAFNREALEAKRFKDKNDNLLNLSKRQILVQSMLPPTISLLASAGMVLLLWLGYRHMESGQLEPSELVSLLLYAVMLTGPISGLANVYGTVMHTRGAAERLLEFFAVQAEPTTEALPNLECSKGAIEFRDVSFAYPDRNRVLNHFNLKIDAGETVAITGPNGAGKSTMAHLLLRFMDPTDGHILIDGTNIKDVSLKSVRDHIGLVAQNTLLLNGSVSENIAYGNVHATEMEIKNAAISARADEFIEALPDRYDTVIGDQGIKLSGGQRQRLSLARTLLKNPRILILDEATAMFDPIGESGFIDESREYLKQRTVILITHRPAGLALANRVLRLAPDETEGASIVTDY